jgi:phage-related protein (TIGR01555 family)
LAGKISASRAKPAPKPEMSAEEQTRAFSRAFERMLRGPARRKPKLTAAELFRPYEPSPGVLPAGMKAADVRSSGMAMDEAPGGGFGSWASGVFGEGLVFAGYPILAEMAQRSEYRRGVEVIAGERTRKWIEFEAIGDKDKSDRISAIENRLNELRARDILRKVISYDGFYGRGHLYLDTGDGQDPGELGTDIGNGRSKLSQSKISPKHPIRALKAIEPVWTYPTNYNASDPLADDWYRPDVWYVMGKRIHRSRLIPMITREAPDLLKPAYSFGGVPLTQLMKPAVDIWLRTRDGIGDLIAAFTTYVLSTDLSTLVQQGGEEKLLRRIAFFNECRDNHGLMVLHKDKEEFTNVSAPLSSLDILQQQSQEHVATAASIPLVKYIGDQPSGLNASSEGTIRMFYDTMSADQEAHDRPIIQTLVDFVQLSLFGDIDEEITFKFKSLWALDGKEEAEVRKTRADTDQIYVDLGAISPEEVRANLATDPASPYDGLDIEDMPSLLEEEMAGLEPQGGRPDPIAGKKAA